MSAQQLSVRRAAPTDAAELARLLTAFNAEFEASTPPPTILERRFTDLLASSGFAALLAGEPGLPAVGFATISLRASVYEGGPVALLEDLYVTPSHRNNGVGSALISALSGLARTHDWALIEIQVDEPDLDAMRFYARHGFTDRDAESGDRALLWWREVEPPAHPESPGHHQHLAPHPPGQSPEPE